MAITYLDDAPKITYLDNQPAQSNTISSTPQPSMGDLATDILARFGKGAYNATSFLPGVKNATADQVYAGIPKASNIGQQIPEALGSVAPTVAMSAPYIAAAKAAGLGSWMANAAGFGAFSGSRSALEGNSLSDNLINTAKGTGIGLISSVLGSAGQGAASGGSNLLSKFISTATNTAPKVISPVAVKTIGTALGQAAGGAATAAPGERLTGALVQGSLGAAFPSKVVDQDAYDAQVAKNGESYKTLLHPTASVIKKVEGGFSNKDINDSYELMAKEGVPIQENNGTFDTRAGQQHLSDAIAPVVQAKQQMLDTNKNPQFDLNDVRREALAQLNKNRSLDPLSLESAAKDINTHINAAITDPRGQGLNVNGQALDALKSQLYGVGYSDLAPTSEIAAKQVASVIKNKIESAYPNLPIKQVNDTIGKYAAAQSLLASAHGTKVVSGKSPLRAAIAGAALGGIATAGTHIVGMNSPILDATLTPVGAGAVTTIQDLIAKAHNDPNRVTKLLKSKLDDLTVR